MTKTITWLILFSIAMAFLESAVVIYLRKIYYPDGFHFPLRAIENSTALVEILREAATLIMLIAIGIIAGQTKIQRFAWFLLCFGVWDIFYYVFLKLFLNWPASVFDPDILFLIPVPWIGPVLAPLILSSLMIILSFTLIQKEKQGSVNLMNPLHRILFISGSLLVIISFIWNFNSYIASHHVSNVSDDPSFPGFNWAVFGAGVVCLLLALLQIIGTGKRKQGK